MLRRLRDDRLGTQLVEYLLILAAISVVAVAGVQTFGTALAAKGEQYAACVRALSGCQPGSDGAETADVVEEAGEPRLFLQSDPIADQPYVVALPNTGSGPDPAGAARAGRPMTIDEANRTLAPLTDPGIADDFDIFLSAFGGPPLSDELAVFEAGGPFSSVLTNPVYVLTDDRGTAYFGLVDGDVVQIDFDSDGQLIGLHVLDDFTAVVWLCDAGHAEACITEAELLAQSASEQELMQAGLELVVGVTPLGIALDVRDAISTCPTSPTSFDCSAALIGFVPGVPGAADEAVNAAQTVVRTVEHGTARFPLTRLPDGRLQTEAGLIYGSDDRFGNRLRHVLAHTRADPSKPNHTVFSVPPREVLPLVDEAWAMRGDPVPGDPGAYIVDMGRPVGTNGETAVKIIVRPGTSEIITAYPVTLPEPSS